MKTFEEICKAEPEIMRLIGVARDLRYTPSYNANDKINAWINYFKPHITAYVGHERKDGPEWLQTSEAYDTAYKSLLDLLGA